jgi:hypothetical protein
MNAHYIANLLDVQGEAGITVRVNGIHVFITVALATEELTSATAGWILQQLEDVRAARLVTCDQTENNAVIRFAWLER